MKHGVTYALAGLFVCAVSATAALATTETTTTTTTERHITSVERPTHRTGSLTIRQVQDDLRAAGFYRGPIDGQMGPRTRQALKDFQHARGLRITGRVDARTERALMTAG